MEATQAPDLANGEPEALRPPPGPPPKDAAPALTAKGVRAQTFVIALTALTATAIGVFVFLPEYVATRQARVLEAAMPPAAVSGAISQSSAGRPAGTTGELARSPSHVRPSALADAQARQRAEEALGDWLLMHARLEAKQVSQWGGGAYERAKVRAAAGEGALQHNDFALASTAYREAVTMLERIEDSIPEVLQSILASADEALGKHDAERAQQGYRLALALHPEHAEASRGLARAERLETVLQRLARGADHERHGRLALAYTDFQAAAQIDSALPATQTALARIKSRIAKEGFQRAMSEGFDALDGERFGEALRAFRRAQDLQPEAPQVQDGIAQARQGLRSAKIADLRQRALAEEQAERWPEALAAYEAALALDPTLAFAQQGRVRSERFGQVAARLQHYLNQPERLTSARVHQKAEAFLAEAWRVVPQGSKSARQLRQLEAQLERAATPLTVELRSDGATEITIYRVGQLGRFTTRSVQLRPGTYTVVGARPGFRDVRHILELAPGEPPAPLYIACQERF